MTRAYWAARLRSAAFNLALAAKLAPALSLSLVLLTGPALAQTTSTFDGRYYSSEYRFGFEISGNQGIATISNSSSYQVGDVMLRFSQTGPSSFEGEHLCTDGVFHPVIGVLNAVGDLELTFEGCWPATMTRQYQLTGSIPVATYNMPNGHGKASGGDFNYWDLAYSGSGATNADDAFLSGGRGDLTDGWTAPDVWYAVESDGGSGPWVGWVNDRRVNPTIQFNFIGSPTIGEIRVHVDNSNVGYVVQPAEYLVNGTPWSFTPLPNGAFGWVTLQGPPVTGNQLFLTLVHHSDWNWIFVSEVAFYGPEGSLPELSLNHSTVAGCKSVTGRVTLSSPAPVGGAIITISDTIAAATPPATVKIAEGTTSKSFTIKTSSVSSNQSGTVTANLDGASSSKPLTIRPMGLSAVKLSPTTIVGGHDATGTATLECAAGPGPVTVDLSTSNAAVAAPVAPTLVVPQGLKSQTFSVTTNPVLSNSSAMITGEASTTTKSRRLNVVPAAAISPTRLAFGNVAVGQTSGPLVATLRNDGVVSFAVNSISLTGTYATWFAQTNNCPANLAAGASCTISVTFRPQAALSKSAKLSIATSATSTPLSVSLSGTGI